MPLSVPCPKMPGILVLAAGLGRRFTAAGGSGNKLLASYPDGCGELRPLLAITLDHATASGLPVRLIVRPESDALITLAQRYRVEVTRLASRGSGASIAAGVADTSHWTGWIIQPADMPWVIAQDYRRVATALTGPISQARCVFNGLPGHPVGFASGWRSALLALDGDGGARGLLKPDYLQELSGGPHNLRDADLPV